MRQVVVVTLAAFFSLSLAAPRAAAEECSAAILSSAASAEGRPILWKNRDTDTLHNKVVFVDETPHAYLGVVDADDASGRRVFAGLNAAGFAIMNTVAYNLPAKSGEARDFEGAIMADALRRCRSVADFAAYLSENRGPGLGSQANFGVIDAIGGAALFEVHNHGFNRLDVQDTPEKYLLVTNFSRSGETDAGRGYVRFERLQALFHADADGKYSVAQVLQEFARDVQNAYLPALAPALLAQLPADTPYFVHTQQTIDRGSTAATAVIRGVDRGQVPGDATLWIILGEPVCGIAVPLWVEAGAVPEELSAGEIAAMNQESMRLKSLLRPFKDSERVEYANLARLQNKAGSGWLSVLLAKERTIFDRTATFLETQPDPAAKLEFEKQMAAEALQTLQGIR
jgi:hypothetical protein